MSYCDACGCLRRLVTLVIRVVSVTVCVNACLRKELKKLRKWWTKARNDERASKAVGETTVEKREVGH